MRSPSHVLAISILLGTAAGEVETGETCEAGECPANNWCGGYMREAGGFTPDVCMDTPCHWNNAAGPGGCPDDVATQASRYAPAANAYNPNACREYDGYDNDCCAGDGTGSGYCAPGYTYSAGGDCFMGAAVTTCCCKDGMTCTGTCAENQKEAKDAATAIAAWQGMATGILVAVIVVPIVGLIGLILGIVCCCIKCQGCPGYRGPKQAGKGTA